MGIVQKGKEAFASIHVNALTCHSAIQYHHDMIDNHFFKYTLLAKLSTNPLEREFSRIRAGTGGVRTITIRNVIQKSRILTAKKF